MNDQLISGLIWLGQSLFVGMLVLGLGRIALMLASLPATRERIATWTIRIALLAPLVCLLPSWWTVELPRSVKATEATATSPAPKPVEPVAEIPNFDEFPEGSVEELVWVMEPTVHDAVEVAKPAEAVVARPEPIVVSSSREESSYWPEFVIGTVALYTLFVLYFLGEFSLGHWALNRLRQRSSMSPQRVQSLASELVGSGHAVLSNDALPSPICFGVARPTIVLPQTLAQRGGHQELKWVLAHEADHLRRGDPLTSCLSSLAKAFYFFCPWFWGVRRELTLAQEHLADAAAIQAGGQPVEYAEFLMMISSGTTVPARRRALPALGVRAGRSQLFRRINMVLATNSGLGRSGSRVWGLLTGGALLGIALLASSWSVASADDEKPKVIKVQVKKPEAAEGEQPKVIVLEARIDDEKAPAQRKDVVVVRADKNVAEIKKKIAAAVKAGKAEEAMKLIEELEKAMAPKVMRMGGELGVDLFVPNAPGAPLAPLPPLPPGAKPVPAVPPMPGVPRVTLLGDMAGVASDAKAKAIEALKKQLKTSESKEAKAAIEAAIQSLEAQSKVEYDVQSNFRYAVDSQNAAIAVAGTGLRERFGLTVETIPEVLAEQMQIERAGALITAVVVDSPAGKAGLRVHEIITHIGKTPIRTDKDVLKELSKLEGGSKVELKVLRKGKETKVTLEIPQAPTASGTLNRTYRFVTAPKVRFEQQTIQINNDEFNIKAKKDDAEYSVVGTLKNGKPSELKIEINADGKKISATSADKLPEPHKTAVQSLLSSISGN
jgi:beta-lactamase regulating signal transducer with metallopeptidase domain